MRLSTVFAEHGEEPEFCGPRQKLVMAFEPRLLIRQFQMNVEILASSPIFVEVKDVRIFFADVKGASICMGLKRRDAVEAGMPFLKGLSSE
jgi:hypothetical protein